MGKISEFYYATSPQDAVNKAKQTGAGAAYLGGGVELVLRRNPEVATLIDLSHCNLDFINVTHEGIEIGSQVTLTTISKNAVVKEYAGGSLTYLAGHIAHNNLRDMITVGGVIGRNQPWNDVVPHLIALDARVLLFDGTDHLVPLAEYIEAKHPGMLIKGVILPAENKTARGSLWRFTRTRQDISLLHCSALIAGDHNMITKANIVFAGRPAHAALYPRLSEELVGRPLTKETFERVAELAPDIVEVGSDLRASGEFRHVLVRAALINLGEHMTEVAQ